MLLTYKLGNVSLSCIRRPQSSYFCLRELDTKMIRCHLKRPEGSTEQAHRVAVTHLLSKLKIRKIPATKEEIAQLKTLRILGRAAPSCSLISWDDTIRLCQELKETKIPKKKRKRDETKQSVLVVGSLVGTEEVDPIQHSRYTNKSVFLSQENFLGYYQ